MKNSNTNISSKQRSAGDPRLSHKRACDGISAKPRASAAAVRLAAAALAAAVAFAPVAAEAARDSRAKEASSDFGIGLVAVFANIVYMPVKVVYGVLGGVTGCFAYVLSGANREVADGVWVPSLGGDYVLTTDMMTGRDHVHFNGVRSRPHEDDSDGRASGAESSGSSF